MTDKARITIAAMLTALFVAAVSTAGLLAHADLDLALSDRAPV